MAVLGQSVRAEAVPWNIPNVYPPGWSLIVLHDRKLVKMRSRRLKPGYQLGGQPTADLGQPMADLRPPPDLQPSATNLSPRKNWHSGPRPKSLFFTLDLSPSFYQPCQSISILVDSGYGRGEALIKALSSTIPLAQVERGWTDSLRCIIPLGLVRPLLHIIPLAQDAVLYFETIPIIC